MTDLWRLGAAALAGHYWAGTASPTEVVESVLGRIDSIDGHIGAFACLQADAALDRAAALTAELALGQTRGPLHGIPVAVKELFDVEGAPADYGSDVLAGEIAPRDAHLVARLRRAGAIVVGTTRSHEFGWGITTQHHTRGSTRNPWDRTRVPGGSSGGSGAAVATGMVPVAVGSDTGGSIRIPASFCGVAGLKPTYGTIGRTGGVALAPTFDTPGALARSLEDAGLLVSVMSGPDPDDPACDGRSFPRPRLTDLSLEGTRIGVAAALTDVELDEGVGKVVESSIGILAGLGAELVEIDLPPAQSMLDTFVPLQMAEAHHVHSRLMGIYPERAADYGADVRGRLEMASSVSLADYLEAMEERQRIIAVFDHQLATVDALFSPIAAVSPSRADHPDEAELDGEVRPLRDLVMRFTVPQNLTGLPTAIVNAGVGPDGMPVGVQLTAGRWLDDRAVRIANALQAAIGPIGLAPDPDQQGR